MSILYHQGKTNVVDDALSRVSMGSATHFEEDKKDLSRDVHTCTFGKSTNGFHIWRSSSDEYG